MKRIALAVLVSLFTMPSVLAQSIGGSYAVNGKNFDGSSYVGTAQIELLSDVTCSIYWQTGGSSSQGICMRSGSVFTAAYSMGNVIGLVIYDASANGTLTGTWTIAGKSGVGYETLTPQ
jgi:hypothetical protein